MQAIFESLAVEQQKTNKELKSLSKSVAELTKAYKGDQRKAENNRRRKSADQPLTITQKIKIEEKEKKNFFQKLLDGFKGIFTAGGLAKLLGALGIGGLIAGYIGSPGFRKAMDDHVFKPLGNFLKEKAWTWMKDNPLKTLGAAAAAMALLIGPKGALGMAFSTLSGSVKLLSAGVGKIVSALGAAGLLKLGAAALPLAGLYAAGKIRDKVQYDRAGGKAGGGDLYNKLNNEMIDFSNTIPGVGKSGAERRAKELNANTGVQERRSIVEAIFKATAELDKERKAAKTTTAADRRGRTKTITDEAKVEAAEKRYQRKIAELEERASKLDALSRQKKQTGGPVRVKGSGYGDRVPMNLPAGSFVLNKKASAYLQNGGMVPTMLEPGEMVYGPGQWGAGTAALNSSVPRFQTGGLVQATHRDTGPGWSIGMDGHNPPRPAVFTRTAAKALLDAIKASDGAVKTSDITSSQRSVDKNRAVGGVPNSNHLSGNAVDIHGTSKAWLKANGEQYGWKNLVYGGHDGHFDFTKAMGGYQPQDEGQEKTTSPNFVQKTFGAVGGFMQGFMEGFNSTASTGLAGFFKDMFSGGGGGGGGHGGGGGGGSSYSPGKGKGVPNDPQFKAEVTRLAKKYNIPEDNLYAVMSFETGGTFDPGQRNMAGSGATGLIQFMPSTARGLGTSTEALAQMSRAEQMKYVEKYFDNAGLPNGASFEDLYMSILYPKAVGKPNSYKLFGKGGDMPGAYSQNAGLDADGDGSITKFEAAAKARKHLQSGGAVMVEPGETIFGPGQWDANTAALNSSVPRFQTGGVTGMRGGNPNYGLPAMQQPVAIQPIIINGGGGSGGGGGTHVENTAAPSVPILPTNSGHPESHYLEMVLAKNIGG